jgi:hypothetical protein
MPKPDFGAPTQDVELNVEADLAWYHVPVSVKRLLFWRRDIPCCRVTLQWLDNAMSECEMKWRSDLPRGSTETHLCAGIERKIPIVYRKDNSDHATVTDVKWLDRFKSIPGVEGNWTSFDDKFISLSPGRYRFQLLVTSGNRKWMSSVYQIRVPDKNTTNGHFNVQFAEVR